MINGIHALLYTQDAEAVRSLFRDVLKFPAVNAGHGWLIFALPPAELGIHPSEGEGHYELYLMCDNLESTIQELQAKGVNLARPVHDAGWGLVTALQLPGGAELGLYQPRHPTAIAGADRSNPRL
jgi:predicted enzyme related to lactoylglutathione lyase